VPYPGYDAGALAAERGFHAFTVDYLGVGESFRPANGWDADFPAQVEAIGFLVDWIRRTRQVDAVDLVGAGYGGGVAAQLASDPEKVRSVTMSAQLYKQVVAGPLLDEEFIAFLRNSPDGYFFAPADGASIFFRDTPLPVQDYLLTTQGGHYPVDNFLVATDRPFYDAPGARAPLLVLYGQQDFLSVQADLEDLVADWGGEARLAILPDGGHAPRLESPEAAAWYWDQVFSFIDP
jgi:pimeloyl-ACP methyl ester carboxylesterase